MRRKEQYEGPKSVSKQSLALIVKQTNIFPFLNVLLFPGNHANYRDYYILANPKLAVTDTDVSVKMILHNQ